MSQLNIHLNPEFEDTLAKFMRIRGIHTKSEAVRIAVQEGLSYSLREAKTSNFREWLGLGKASPENPKPRFDSDSLLWE